MTPAKRLVLMAHLQEAQQRLHSAQMVVGDMDASGGLLRTLHFLYVELEQINNLVSTVYEEFE